MDGLVDGAPLVITREVFLEVAFVLAVRPGTTAAQRREPASNQNPSVRLHGDRVHHVVRARIEARLEPAGRIEPRDPAARRGACVAAAEPGEGAADENPAIRLHGQRGDTRVGWSSARACGNVGEASDATSLPDFHHAPGDFGLERAATFYPASSPDLREICPDIRHTQT